ncbi:MAG: AAA family ATPase [Desulfuromonadaceae bacterium]|nr:AAA family ATPase [Desulfuromonadaceae bacterium]
MSMCEEKIAIGKKLVWARKPYQPEDNVMIEFTGREEELKMVAAAWLSSISSQPLSPLLVGPPGCGKNRIVYEMAKRCGLDLYVCQGYENITAEELACSLLPADEGNGRIDYLISALATAMYRGGICFIDEIGKFPGKALSLLASVLDDRRYLDLDLIGERIHAHPQFRFICATNSEDMEGLPDFVRSRLFPLIRIDKPVPELINTMIRNQFQGQQHGVDKLLNSFWRLWDKNSSEEDAPSPRDVIQIFSLADKLADYDADGARSISTTHQLDIREKPGQSARNTRIAQVHLEKALLQFHEMRGDVPC